MQIYWILIYISLGSVLIPLAASLQGFNFRSKFFKLLALLVFLSALSDYSGLFVLTNQIGNSYTLLEFAILTYLYFLLFKSNNEKRVLLISASGILLISVFVLDAFSNYDEGNMEIRLLECFWFVLLSIWYFVTLLSGPPAKDLSKSPYFWFNIAILLYFSGNTVMLAAQTFAASASNQNLYYLYIPIHSSLNVAKNLIFAYCFRLEYKQLSANG